MRRISLKRQALLRKANPIRRSLIERVGKCEICGACPSRPKPGPTELSQLCVHEIANGPLRHKALDKLYAVLVVCWGCNYELCNKSLWPERRQLSVLKRARPGDYSLADYNTLVNPSAPHRITEEEVDAEI